MKKMIFSNKGLTLVEVMITAVTMVAIIGVALYAFVILSAGWSAQNTRAGLNIKIDRALEEMTRELREARVVASVNNDEIRYTLDEANFYIYYLYNSNDTYPSGFSEASYEIRKTPLTGGISGTFTYGAGRLIVGDVEPPATTDLSFDGSLVTVDLTLSRGSESIRANTTLKPRNLP